MKKLLSFLLTVGVLVSCGTLTVLADSFRFVLEENAEPLDPVPLLFIRVSFDADGDGEDDYDPKSPSKLYSNKTAPYYGEQWIHSMASRFYNVAYGSSNSLNNYYKALSGGRFFFSPADESYEDAALENYENDGIIDVVLKVAHPQAMALKNGVSNDNQYSYDYGQRTMALEASDKYIDYSKYDKDGDGYVTSFELAIVFVYGGYEYSSGKQSALSHFGVWAHCSYNAGVTLDGVKVSERANAKYVRLGECVTGTVDIMKMGTVAHELGHVFGAYDLYDTDSSGISWPSVGSMSLMASGSHSGNGAHPAQLDPYHMAMFGFVLPSAVSCDTKEYTLYSLDSEEGAYNVLRVNTPDPKEYYLVELRTATGVDSSMPSTATGVFVWHIDEDIINTFSSGINASTKTGGEIDHDPAVVLMHASGLYNGAKTGFSANSANPKYTEFVSTNYLSPKDGVPSLNSFPEDYEGDPCDFCVRIKVLSSLGEEATVSVSGAYPSGPLVGGHSGSVTHESAVLSGSITSMNGNDYCTDCGFIVSKSGSPDAGNGTVYPCVPDESGVFSVGLTDLSPNTRYYVRTYVKGVMGETETESSSVFSFYTRHKPIERDYFYAEYNVLGGLPKIWDAKVTIGDRIPVPDSTKVIKRGFVQGGWYRDGDFTERFDFDYVHDSSTNLTIYLRWIETAKAVYITYVDGGRSESSGYALSVGDVIEAPQPPTAGEEEREGMIFTGWYRDEALTEQFDFTVPLSEAGKLKLYAGWYDPNAPTVFPPRWLSLGAAAMLDERRLYIANHEKP
ncbi:MAG: M6 family metalloprotease domain-containing protein [Clostridia bacterium]|nr:M6 family metalloprotease domain-containing protein [Clostridia bacterium]